MAKRPPTEEEIAERDAANANKRPYTKKMKTDASSTSATGETGTMEPGPSSASTGSATASGTWAPEPATKNPEPATPNPQPATEFPTPPASPNPPAGSTMKKPFRPFVGAPIQRSYSTPQVDPELLGREIPEAPLGGGPSAAGGPSPSKLLDQPISTEPSTAQKISTETGLNELDPKERQAAHAMTADLTLVAYDKLHELGREYMRVKDQKLFNLHLENKIDLHSTFIEADHQNQIPQMTVLDFFKDVNNQIDKEFVVTEDFKEKVRGPLERIYAKYGIGVTDGWYVAGLFAADAGPKVMAAFSIKRVIKDALKSLQDRHEQMEAEVARRVAAAVARNTTAASRASATVNEQGGAPSNGDAGTMEHGSNGDPEEENKAAA